MDKTMLRNIHDALKQHPYRKYCSKDDETDYAYNLLLLANEWCRIIYADHGSDEANRKWKQFGEWIHNYKAILNRNEASPNYWTNYADYFEQVLQMTHRFIETGDFDTYFYASKRDDGTRYGKYVTETYIYVTKEDTGLSDNPYLPCYLCTSEPYNTDENTMHNEICKYAFDQNRAEEQFQKWKQCEKPLWDFMNKKYHKILQNK